MRSTDFAVSRKRASDVRQKLFQNAEKLFLEKGYENVSIDEICRTVGVTKGAFYGYFKSKDQIILEAMVQHDTQYRTSLLPQVSGMEAGVGKLVAYLRLAMRYQGNITKENIRLHYSIRISNTEEAPHLIPDKRELYRVLLELIREGQKQGDITGDQPAAQIATDLLYCIRGLIYSWCLPGSRFDLIKTSDSVWDLMQPGLRKQ